MFLIQINIRTVFVGKLLLYEGRVRIQVLRHTQELLWMEDQDIITEI